MLSVDILKSKLISIKSKDYGAYQSLLGEYAFSDFILDISQIPKDPYAPPHTGIYRIVLDRNDQRVVNYDTSSKTREIAFCDFLARHFSNACRKISKGRRGTGYSGIITINQPGQCILKRNCVVVYDDLLEIRCFLGLPANGRTTNVKLAEEMLFKELPEIVRQAMFNENTNQISLKQHIEIAEDTQFLREKLDALRIVAFIPDKSILPRASGCSDKVLDNNIVPFLSPESLALTVDLPHAGKIRGMGIPEGVTLVVGGGYHGKSTLLNAVESGIYNHVPGDGRELCVALPQTVKIRAYSGRYIRKTDISPFIKNLPMQSDTTAFSTENASGSTSQAASIIETMELGGRLLLMDEDTCATNFMIRDTKMQQLVNKDDEPITTFIDKIRQLYTDKKISTILVLGGTGDYFDVADQVIQMKRFQPVEVTEKAKKISKLSPAKREIEDRGYPFVIHERIPVAESIDPCNYYGKKGIYATEVYHLVFGKQKLDLTDLEQLVELAQTKAIGFAIEYARRYMGESSTLRTVVEHVARDIEEHGLDIISDRLSGNFAEFRSFELAFALNRMRGFEVKQKEINSS